MRQGSQAPLAARLRCSRVRPPPFRRVSGGGSKSVCAARQNSARTVSAFCRKTTPLIGMGKGGMATAAQRKRNESHTVAEPAMSGSMKRYVRTRRDVPVEPSKLGRPRVVRPI